MIREGTSLNDLGSFLIAEKNALSDPLSLPSAAVDGRPAVPLHLVDSSDCRAVSRSLQVFKIDCASLTNSARVQLWFRKDGTSVTNDNFISIWRVLNETLLLGRTHFYFYGMMASMNCCLAFVRNYALPNARHIFNGDIVKNSQQHRLLGNTAYGQLSGTLTISTLVASSAKCFGSFVRVCKELFHKKVSLRSVYFTSATLYRASVDE